MTDKHGRPLAIGQSVTMTHKGKFRAGVVVALAPKAQEPSDFFDRVDMVKIAYTSGHAFPWQFADSLEVER
jgi:hypothetical protein